MTPKKAGKISPNYMDRIYVPSPDCPWRKKKNGTIEVDLEHTGLFPTITQKFFKKPRVSHIALDKYGSALWQALDGKNSVMDVVNAMEEAFPKEKDDMLKRVVTFLGTLETNKFITVKKN